jgi:O-antigen ligase
VNTLLATRLQRFDPKRLVIWTICAIACIGVSFGVATGRAVWVLGSLSVVAAIGVALHKWQWSVYGLLIYLPFSGIPIIVAYPHTEIAVLAKDILFVLPAYLGFTLGLRRRGWSFPGAPVVLLLMLSLLLIVQSAPQLNNPLVPLIGLKVWLFYVPLLFLGYHLVASRTELTFLLRMMSLIAIPTLVIGVIEALILDTGNSQIVYRFYGPAAQAVTQGFAVFDYGSDGRLLRVPSTFSFVSQYYDFTAAMTVVSFAWWQLTRHRLGLVVWMLALIASFSSGARSAFVLTPLLVVFMAILARSGRSSTISAMMLLGGAGIASLALGLSASNLLLTSADIGSQEFQAGFLSGIPNALRLTVTGFGTGQATGAARYVLGDSGGSYTYDPTFSESWWVKIILEIGVPGLILFGAIFAVLIWRAYKNHRRLKDSQLLPVSAALLGFLIWTLVYLTKGVEIDLDPINVYFWLFAGLLLKLPTLAVEHARSDARVAGMGLRRSLTRVGVELEPSTP